MHNNVLIFFVIYIEYFVDVGCSSGYSLANYSLFASINSQINEQANAGLKRIKDQLSCMTAENFLKHCCFYLWNRNRLKKNLVV
jgi:hypothetical protein